MKKILTLLLAGIMLLSFTAVTLAAGDASGGKQAQENKTSQIKVKDLQGYDELLQLREEGKATREQIKAGKQDLKDLLKAAKDTQNEAALPIIKEYRANLQGLRTDLQTLRTTQKSNWETMKTARQAGDQTQMESILEGIISTRQALNAKLVEIETSVDQFIQALQGI